MASIYYSNALNVEQEALSTTQEEVVPARLTRKRVIIKNLDTAIAVYVGFDDTVASTTGMELKAGESITLETTAAIWMEAASGTPTVSFLEEYVS
jgi:hypothetical protein